jgi:glutathione S-transferase
MADAMFKRPPVAQRGALGWGSIEEVIAAVEAALRPGPWLLGDRFSAADVYIGAEFSWAEMFGLPQLLQSSVIKAYIARCRERPAYARTMGAR